MSARLAWSFALVSLVCAVGDTVVTAAHRRLLSEEVIAVHGWPLAPAATVGGAVMGAMIVSRYPRHPIGWLLCVIGAVGAVSLLAESYSIWTLEADGPGPDRAGHIAAWVSVLIGGQVALGLFAVVFLTAPDGHLLSRRWRYAVVTAGLGVASYTAGLLTLSPLDFVVTRERSGSHPLTGVLFGVGVLLVALAMAAAVASMIRRLRRAHGDERQQLRLITLAAGAIAGGLVWLITVQQFNGGEQDWLAALPLFASYLLLPICIAIAVLRYRLYDIEVIINRALVLAAGTVFAAVGYVSLVVGVGAAVGAGSDAFWASLIAMVLVALAFQPLRRRVVRLADRIAYGSRAAPYEALADFSRRLGGSPAPEALLPTIAEATAAAMSADQVTVRLLVPDGADLTARWPVGRTISPVALQATEIGVVDRGERLGSISVVMPPGRSLRPGDRVLLAGLADATALAFRNHRLAARLAGRVVMLDLQTAQLAESRGRIIAARDDERDALEQAIRAEIAPYLHQTPDRLRRLAGDVGGRGTARELSGVLSDSVTALENLRELTRGIMPSQLARSGLASAMSAHLGHAGHAGALTVDESAVGMRLDRRIETTAYFALVEALGHLDPPVDVTLAVSGDVLGLEVGGSADRRPTTAALSDRIESLGGSAHWTSDHGRAALAIHLPIGPTSTCT